MQSNEKQLEIFKTMKIIIVFAACYQMNTDSPNHQIGDFFHADSAYYCQAGCQLNSSCLYFVFVTGYNSCFHKSGSDAGYFVPYLNVISGQKFCDGKGVILTKVL